MLVVGDRDRRDVSGDFRSERGLPRCDEGIVGGLEALRVVQVEIAVAHDSGEKHRTDGDDDGAATQQAFSALGAARLRPLFFGLSRQFGLLGVRAVRWQMSPRLDLLFRGGGRNEMRAFNYP